MYIYNFFGMVFFWQQKSVKEDESLFQNTFWFKEGMVATITSSIACGVKKSDLQQKSDQSWGAVWKWFRFVQKNMHPPGN